VIFKLYRRVVKIDNKLRYEWLKIQDTQVYPAYQRPSSCMRIFEYRVFPCFSFTHLSATSSQHGPVTCM